MPKRKDLKKILVVGAGPIIIGQACEFDYSGTQACKALKDEGYKVILINSNPATIMTDPGVADKTYIEPITKEILEKILIKEKPDAILPTMGGQTALNLAMEAEKNGLLKKYKIELIGANSTAISNASSNGAGPIKHELAIVTPDFVQRSIYSFFATSDFCISFAAILAKILLASVRGYPFSDSSVSLVFIVGVNKKPLVAGGC